MSPPQRIDLKLVDEGFSADAAAPATDKLKANMAAAIREGRRRQRIAQDAETERLALEHAAKLRGIHEAHEGEMKRNGRLIGKAAFREGGLLGLVFGMGLAASIIAGTYWVMKDAVILNTATQRVNHSLDAGPVPSLNDGYREIGRPGEAP